MPRGLGGVARAAHRAQPQSWRGVPRPLRPHPAAPDHPCPPGEPRQSRVSPSPPPHANEQAQIGVRTLAVPLPRMRRSVGTSVSTLRSGRSVPVRSGEISPRPAGLIAPTRPVCGSPACPHRPSSAFGFRANGSPAAPAGGRPPPVAWRNRPRSLRSRRRGPLVSGSAEKCGCACRRWRSKREGADG